MSLKIQMSSPTQYWKVLKLKRLVRGVKNNSTRPLASLWSDHSSALAGVPLDVQLNVVCSWAESIYGKGAGNRLGLVEKTEDLVSRSERIYRDCSIDMNKKPVTISDPLRVVMAELDY